MCGLWAWFDSHSNELSFEAKQQKSIQALNALSHRGPDSQTLWSDAQEHVFLGHTRLAITGLRGEQPLWSEDRQIAVLVNGEFYDFESLKKTCQHQGYVFKTDTDSELLIALYLEYGKKALEFLQGEFAFILWDKRHQQLWTVRDRTGIKPLRYYQGQEGLMFASEIQAFEAWGLPLHWNETALYEAFALQYPRPDRTFYQHISQIEPGESLVWKQQGTTWRIVEKNRYWSWYSKPPLSFSDENEVAEFVEIELQKALSKRLQTNWPIAIHLSGGLDSSSLLALASETHHSITAFGVGFDNVGGEVCHDESVIAEKTAQHLGVDFIRVDGTKGNIVEDWIQAVSHAKSIAINGHIVAKWRLNQVISQHGFRIAMTGEGADEALLGYPFFKLDGQMMGLWEDNSQHVFKANPVSRGLMLPDEQGFSLQPILKQWGMIPTWLKAKSSLGSKLQSLLLEPHISDEILTQWAQDPIELNPFLNRNLLSGGAASWAVRSLGGYILPTLGDAMEGAFGIEGRLPFLDSSFLDNVTRIPPELTRTQNQEKGPLRTLLQKRGLHELSQRQKHPFQAPPLWSQPLVREQLTERWSDIDFYRRLPMLSSKAIFALMKRLNQNNLNLQQVYEPVIGFLLSLDALSLKMK